MTNRVLNQSVFDGQPGHFKWAMYCAETGAVRLRHNQPNFRNGMLQKSWIGTQVEYPVPLTPSDELQKDEVLQRVADCSEAPAPAAPVLSLDHLQNVLNSQAWANYAAVDADGVAHLYTALPVRQSGESWHAFGEQQQVPGRFDTYHWETLVYPSARPVPPPPVTAADLAPGFAEAPAEPTVAQLQEHIRKLHFGIKLLAEQGVITFDAAQHMTQDAP